ncbi:MAG TPA: hypothetical protein VLF67_03700 [Candidatus Saccharimonas sp.]|nr:hypothetical protein [Candidatus Saccharimonas sp.]
MTNASPAVLGAAAFLAQNGKGESGELDNLYREPAEAPELFHDLDGVVGLLSQGRLRVEHTPSVKAGILGWGVTGVVINAATGQRRPFGVHGFGVWWMD